MKELRNSFYKKVTFTDLEKAKKYYFPYDSYRAAEDDFLGSDYELYLKRYDRYQEEVENADSLEALAEVLNSYTDDFGNGSRYIVVEI